MLTVHHLRLSQSERIVWLCEELGVEYDLKNYVRREDNNLAPDEYKALHSMGIAPVITDNDMVLGESGAICEYIDRKYGGSRLSPGPDHPDFADHLFWLHFANGTFMATGMCEIVCAYTGATPPDFVEDRSRRGWALVETRLGEAEFFGGSQLTTADVMMGFALTTMRDFVEHSLDDSPNLRAYLARIGARPAYRRAMAKCEPGMTPKLD